MDACDNQAAGVDGFPWQRGGHDDACFFGILLSTSACVKPVARKGMDRVE